MKKVLRTIGILSILICSLFVFSTNAFAQSCATAPNSSECINERLGLDQRLGIERFFPKLSFNDLIGSTITLILAFIVVFFGIRIILAGYKLVNNDAQDKGKKDAIKTLTNGCTGIFIAFIAYFITLFIQNLFGTNDQIIQCTALYYKDFESYEVNSKAANINDTKVEFQRCISAAGKRVALENAGTYSKFTAALASKCEGRLPGAGGGFVTIVNSNSTSPGNNPSPGTSLTNVNINDYDKLYKCFGEQIKNI